MDKRQIVLDTETTGLDPKQGHRVIEIGAVELINRQFSGNTFHEYINPNRQIDAGAFSVHGISNAFLADKPPFIEIAMPFWEFIQDAELIIHNAPFDLGFLNHELARLPQKLSSIEKTCAVTDTLALARSKHPGQKNNLDALCKRYQIDNTNREWHGALKDARLLAQVYLAMTGGQENFFAKLTANNGANSADIFQAQNSANTHTADFAKASTARTRTKRIIRPTDAEHSAHLAYLEQLAKKSGRKLWESEDKK